MALLNPSALRHLITLAVSNSRGLITTFIFVSQIAADSLARKTGISFNKCFRKCRLFKFTLRSDYAKTSWVFCRWVRAADGGQRRREARKEAAALFKDARKLERQAVTGVLRSVKVLCGTLTGFSGALQVGAVAGEGLRFQYIEKSRIVESVGTRKPCGVSTLS